MCFSAGASFTGGVVLSAIGVATIKKNHEPSHKLFAGIPLFFAFQQYAEGVLWLTLRSGGNDQLQEMAAYFFLATALVIWPTMIPLAVMRMEEEKKRKKIIAGILSAGVILSAYYAYCLLAYNVTPRINEFHIQYISNFPRSLRYTCFGLYAFVTITPLFISGIRKIKLFGILIFMSCLVTGIFYKEYLTSVWCFFAALISVVVYFIVKETQMESVPIDYKLLRTFSDVKSWRNRFRF